MPRLGISQKRLIKYLGCNLLNLNMDAKHMKLIKTLLATTLTLAAATTFAASGHEKTQPTEEKVIVSTQEQPETQGATTDATASEATPASTSATN